MARPIKLRKIDYIPTVQYFVPSEKMLDQMDLNILKLEELEAVRLKDLEGLEQDECAERMEVSRPTFQRILLIARKKITDSLINGKGIHIEGGNFTRNICPLKCLNCGRQWNESFENLESIPKGQFVCTECGSTQVICMNRRKGNLCNTGCHRYGKREK